MSSSRISSVSTSNLSYNDPEYENDGTSVGSDIRNESKSRSGLPSDDETSGDEAGRSAEYYRAIARNINSTTITNKYTRSTTAQQNNIKLQWQQYCKTIVNRDPVEMMVNLTAGDYKSFLSWKLDQKKGPDEKKKRKLRGTKAASSLGTYRKNFLILYRKVTERDMDSEMKEKTLILTRDLAQEYDLSFQPAEKPLMDVKDVLEIVQTTLTTTQKMFDVGRYRIQTCFFIQGGFITANRPTALLGLRYRDVKLSIQRHPDGGPHNILIELTYRNTKTYLGPKPSNTFDIPEILFDPSLCMSPHVYLLGLMFHDNVFLNSDLTPEDLYKLDIRPECNELVIPLKETVFDLCVFRRYDKTTTRRVISNEDLPYYTVKQHMKQVGEIAGFKEVAKPYCLRYGSGNAFDQNGDVSENLRNMIMNHSNSRVFLNHYGSRNIRLDVQAVVRGTMPQSELIQAATRMSRSIDPDRPRSLTTEQSQSVNQDPEIYRLLRKLKKLSKGSPGYEEHVRRIRNEKQQKRNALLKTIRREYDRKRAMEDIQLQLSGGKFEKKIKTGLNQCVRRTQQHKELIASLMSLPGSTIEEEAKRRVKAIKEVASYCGYEEGGTPRNRIEDASANSMPQETVDMDENKIEHAKKVLVEEKRPKICFICLGNKHLAVEQRVYRFSSPGDLSKHFKGHLRKFNESTGEKCELCNEHLETVMDMRRHAFELHGTVSNSFR